MFFTSSAYVYDSEDLPSLGLMPVTSPLHMVSSLPSPLFANIAHTAAVATAVAICATVSLIYP